MSDAGAPATKTDRLPAGPHWCCWCRLHVAPPLVLTREHLVARTHGGSNRDENIAMCCHRCNTMRGDIELAEWASAVAVAFDAGVPNKRVARAARFLCGVPCKGQPMSDRLKALLLDELVRRTAWLTPSDRPAILSPETPDPLLQGAHR